MFTPRPSDARGLTRIDWLHSRHTFSFGDYHDPRHMGFRSLRVLNDDLVAPGRGFGTHGHRDMEILTLVLSGALAHKDSLGHTETLRPGEAQVMTAGTGIRHSEFNPSPTEPVHFLQMWILPRATGLPPAYSQRPFPRGDAPASVARIAGLVGTHDADGALPIQADASVFRLDLRPSAAARLPIAQGRAAWIHVATGSVRVGPHTLAAGDGLAATDEPEIALDAGAEGCLAVVFDLA